MILWLRLLDSLGSAWRRYWKYRRIRNRFPGSDPKNVSRPGRRYTSVKEISPEVDLVTGGTNFYRLREEPGWEWDCPQCHTYSLVTESMMPAILDEWRKRASAAREKGFKASKQPTAKTVGCPECRYLPGAPE